MGPQNFWGSGRNRCGLGGAFPHLLGKRQDFWGLWATKNFKPPTGVKFSPPFPNSPDFWGPRNPGSTGFTPLWGFGDTQRGWSLGAFGGTLWGALGFWAPKAIPRVGKESALGVPPWDVVLPFLPAGVLGPKGVRKPGRRAEGVSFLQNPQGGSSLCSRGF